MDLRNAVQDRPHRIPSQLPLLKQALDQLLATMDAPPPPPTGGAGPQTVGVRSWGAASPGERLAQAKRMEIGDTETGLREAIANSLCGVIRRIGGSAERIKALDGTFTVRRTA